MSAVPLQVHGAPVFHETLLGLSFRISPTAFFQVTPPISSGMIFTLNTIWPTKITTHRFYY